MTVSGNLKQIKKPCYLIDPRHTKWLSMWDSITGLARRWATKVGRAQEHGPEPRRPPPFVRAARTLTFERPGSHLHRARHAL